MQNSHNYGEIADSSSILIHQRTTEARKSFMHANYSIYGKWLHPISPKVRKFEGSRVRRFFSPKVRKLEKKRFWSPNEKVL